MVPLRADAGLGQARAAAVVPGELELVTVALPVVTLEQPARARALAAKSAAHRALDEVKCMCPSWQKSGSTQGE
ncbi:unannotated protein [freshwater metagenome]|uniref:Unannotated protein n=1 Tax=freshwater metagenome TaxID=449393 RepID=A0A6J7EER6_9ZZZZ